MKDKANKGYWQRLAKIYAPLMESDKKFYNAICGYIIDARDGSVIQRVQAGWAVSTGDN